MYHICNRPIIDCAPNRTLYYGIAYSLSSAIVPSNLERLLQLFGEEKEPVPNKLTLQMGELVRQAREDAGLSQTELARKIYRRRATVSDIENGKSEMTISTLTLIAASLDKPISYFLPWFVYDNIKAEDLDPAEHELLLHFRLIGSKHLKQLAIKQVKLIPESEYEIFKDDKEGYADQLLSEKHD